MTVLISGCGDVGMRLVDELSERTEIIGLRRTPQPANENMTWVAADVSTPLHTSLHDTFRDVSTIVHMASPDERTADAYRRVYVNGLLNVLGCVERAGAPLKRVILVTSTATFGRTDGEWVDEFSPPATLSSTARVLLDAEDQLVRRVGSKAVIARPSGIYGPGRTRLIDSVRDGSAACSRDHDVWTNRVHADDVAAALALLVMSPVVADKYVISDNEPATRHAVLSWLASEIGVDHTDGPASELDGLTSRRCHNTRMRSLGWRPAYPDFRVGYRSILSPTGI